MKLNYFSEQTIPKTRNSWRRDPAIHFGKNGLITLNASLAELISLKNGDKLTFAQDDTHPENWYFFKDKTNGFLLNVNPKKSVYQLSHKGLVKMFYGCFELSTDRSYRFKIEDKPEKMKGSDTEYWKIIVEVEPETAEAE